MSLNSYDTGYNKQNKCFFLQVHFNNLLPLYAYGTFPASSHFMVHCESFFCSSVHICQTHNTFMNKTSNFDRNLRCVSPHSTLEIRLRLCKVQVRHRLLLCLCTFRGYSCYYYCSGWMFCRRMGFRLSVF